MQKKNLKKTTKATYTCIHFAAHNLNLVLNDAAGAVKEASVFFMVLQELYTFIDTVQR